MNLNDLTIGEVKELSSMFGSQCGNNHPWEIGENYLIRTVTMTISGKLIGVYEHELVMNEAAWIADTGRFHDSLKDSENFAEIEPFIEPAIIGRGSIIDATKIKTLPRKQK